MVYSKSEQTRQKLIEATAHLMRIKGYASMGLNDIVSNSGIPKGSLYHQFPGGKEELAAETVRFSGEKMHTSLTRLAEKTGGPIEGVAAFCDYYIDQLRKSGYRNGCPLATVALETAADAPLVQQACSAAFKSHSDFLSALLAQKGVPAKQAADAALVTIALLEGALLLAKAHNDTAPLETVRDQLTGRLQNLIQT